MRPQSAEQRQEYADIVCELALEWIVRREADFDMSIQRGVEWCPNNATGDPTPRANPTITLTLTINGGAEDSEGPAILPSPPIFRGPDE